MSYVPLGELVEIKGGGTPSRSNPGYWGGPIPWATVKDFKSTILHSTEESITLDGVRESATNLIRAGAVIVPTRMAVGKAAINTIDLAINQDLKALLPSSKVDLNFLLHFLLSKSEELGARAQGATVKGIKLDLLRELPFPRLGVDQQRRIAAILDRADEIRRKREEALALADDLLKSAFQQMFGDFGVNAVGWSAKKISEVVSQERPVTYGILMPGPDVQEGVPYIRVTDMRDGGVAESQVRRTSREIAEEYRRSTLKTGDLLISIRGHVGRLAFVPRSLEGANITQDTARLAIADQADAIYVRSCLENAAFQQLMAQRTKGGAVKGINLGDLREIQIPMAPKMLRKRYAKFWLKTQSARAALRSSLAEAKDLFASLSQRAFRGEL